MENIVSYWQELDDREVLDTLLDLCSGPVYKPQLLGDDLYSPPFTLPRSRLGFAGRLAVPEACCVVVRGCHGFCHTFGPGVHSLRICPPGQLSGQLVDMSQRSLNINLSSLRTADLALVSLHLNVAFRVDNPRTIVRINSPLQTLTKMVESTTRRVIENLPHRSLFGNVDVSPLANKATLERQIRCALHAELALNGLRILSIKIVQVEGDPTYLALAAQAILAKQQLLAEETALQTRRLLAMSQRELILFQAETERLAASTKEEAALDDARRQADIFDLENARREFQRMMEETRLAHERAMARIKALGQATTALADPRHLAVANATYAHTGYTDGRDQALAQVVNSLVEREAAGVPADSNGHSSH